MTAKARRAAPAALQLGLTGEALAETVYGIAQPLGLWVAHFQRVRIWDDRANRWRWYTPARWQGKGWLDLFIADPAGGGILWRECKGQDESTTPEQRAWIACLQANGRDVDVWRPADLYSRRIERELKAVVAQRPRPAA